MGMVAIASISECQREECCASLQYAIALAADTGHIPCQNASGDSIIELCLCNNAGRLTTLSSPPLPVPSPSLIACPCALFPLLRLRCLWPWWCFLCPCDRACSLASVILELEA